MTENKNSQNQRINDLQNLLAQRSDLSEATFDEIKEALTSNTEPFGYNAKGQLKVAMFDTRSYDRASFSMHQSKNIEIVHIDSALNIASLVQAKNCLAICIFVNDVCDAKVIEQLSALGVKLIALRCAGFNNVDLAACKQHNIDVVRVPEYSPYAVAEHSVALMLMLNRKLHKAYMRNLSDQFVLDGLVGFDMHGKTVGVVGCGKIGRCVINILLGFGCRVLAYDLQPHASILNRKGIELVSLDELVTGSDIITLHAPLTQQTHHLIDNSAIERMQDEVMIINTSRGALIDTHALIKGLKSGKIGAAGLDVYEEEASIFFHDMSNKVITDDVFARLTTFNNVVITSHQGFLTNEALSNIAETTMQSLQEFHSGKRGNAFSNWVEN